MALAVAREGFPNIPVLHPGGFTVEDLPEASAIT
jgi:hypothetical protein